MGNGIVKTHPVGVLKAPPKVVKFGKPEVRTFEKNSWCTKPLLNTNEVARLERKIRTAEMTPVQIVQQPKIVRQQPPKPPIAPKKVKGINMLKVLPAVGLIALTAVLCVLMGPFGLMIPAALAFWIYVFVPYICGPTKEKRKVDQKQYAQAKINAQNHVTKLVNKYERAGLFVQAEIYKQVLKNLSESKMK
jgi:hypothetical protein